MSGLKSPLRGDADFELGDPFSHPGYLKLIEDSNSTLFHTPDWLGVLKATYGFKPEAAILAQKGKPVASLPFVRLDDPAGKRLAALSFSDYCDPVLDDPSLAAQLFSGLINLDPQQAVNLRLLNAPDPPKKLGFKKIKTARWHGLDLSPGIDQMKMSLHESFRRAVQKARKAGLKIRRLEKPELRSFYLLHLAVRKYRYRLLSQPFLFFSNIWDAFVEPGRGFFLGAFLDGKLIAAHCYLAWKKTLIYKFGASDYLYQQLRANNTLHWTAAEEAVKSGFKDLDLGLSDDDQPGLITYKRHLGAMEKEIRFFSRVPREHPSAPGWKETLKETTSIATAPEVPDSLTEKVGDIFYRYFA